MKRNVFSRQFIVFALAMIVFCFSMICNLQATTINKESSQKASDIKPSDINDAKALPHRVQIKGDTLVIQDASCQSRKKTLLSSLRSNDSKQTMAQECDE